MSFISIDSSGTLAYGTNKDDVLLVKIHQLQIQVKNLRRTMEELSKENEKLQANGGFTDEETRFILMRCHPDHNQGSKIALQLTQKLVRNRKK